MKRHTPTLFTHPEQDVDVDVDEDGPWPPSRSHSFAQSPSMMSLNSRPKPRQRNTGPSTSSLNSTLSPRPQYPNVYNQFVRRYRSAPDTDDPRNDPDSHFYQRGYGQPDGGDSDDEDRGLLAGLNGDSDRLSALVLDSEPIEPQTLEDRERLEWQTMLASVLAGDVLKAENTRIAVALKSSQEEENNLRNNLWLGIRAKFHGRSVEEERQKLEERRLRTVDAIIKEIMAFRVEDPPEGCLDPPATYALEQVSAVLHKLEVAQSLYSSLRNFFLDNPGANDADFHARCDTLTTWYTVITYLRSTTALMGKWIGSETLDVLQPTSSLQRPSAGRPNVDPENGTTFVERLLKEEGIQRQVEKGSMTVIHALVGTTRDAHVNLAPMFKEMNLPTFEKELVPLVSFLTNVAQEVLRVRLDYAQKLKSPDVLIIDQLVEDLKVKIGFACTLKRQYEAFLVPDPGGNWKLPPCISEDYDAVILEALTFFFKLINWKLKSGAKGIQSKETDIIEAQWATFSDVSLTIPGGATLVAEQLW